MAPTLPRSPQPPRTSFHSSNLVRLLAALDVTAVAGSTQTFAERLSPWLDWTDAIALSAALQAGGAAPAQAPANIGALRDDLARVRADLVQSITTDDGLVAAPPGPRASAAAPGAAADDSTADFSPCRRSYLAQQRAMDARIGALRLRVRAALSRQSAGLRQLAALDAVLDDALLARERHLLASIPSLLEQHFERQHQQHQARHGPSAPAAWLTLFRQDMQRVLLAELDVRLQPVDGLVDALDALGHEARKQQ